MIKQKTKNTYQTSNFVEKYNYIIKKTFEF